MNYTIDSASALAHRILSKKAQWKILGIAAMAIAFIPALLLLGNRLFAKPAQNIPSVTDGKTFHLSDAQFASLKVESVKTVSFSTQENTDGKIALNTDAMTPVFSPYSGRIVRVFVSTGDHVKEGEPLLAVVSIEYNDAQNELRNAQAQYDLAKANEARKHSSYEAKGASLQDWQQAQTDLATADSALLAARNHLRVFGKSDADIDHILQSQNLDALTRITSPINGIVTDRQAGPGQNIQANAATSVFTIGDLSKVWLVANVRESDAPKLKLGQKIEAHVLALPGKKFSSTLNYIGSSVDPVTRRVPVRAILDNSAGLLKPEMFADFDIACSSEAMMVAIPAEAIIYEGDSSRVWVVQNHHDIELRDIRTGRSNNGMVEVLNGLKPDENVVTSGSLFIDRAVRVD